MKICQLVSILLTFTFQSETCSSLIMFLDRNFVSLELKMEPRIFYF